MYPLHRTLHIALMNALHHLLHSTPCKALLNVFISFNTVQTLLILINVLNESQTTQSLDN